MKSHSIGGLSSLKRVNQRFNGVREEPHIPDVYVRNSYASNIDQVTAAILNEYTVKAVTRR